MDAASQALALFIGIALAAILLAIGLLIYVSKYSKEKRRREFDAAILENEKRLITHQFGMLQGTRQREIENAKQVLQAELDRSAETRTNALIALEDTWLKKAAEMESAFAAKTKDFAAIRDLQAEEDRIKRRLEDQAVVEAGAMKQYADERQLRVQEKEQLDLQIAECNKELESLSDAMDLREFGFYKQQYHAGCEISPRRNDREADGIDDRCRRERRTQIPLVEYVYCQAVTKGISV